MKMSLGFFKAAIACLCLLVGQGAFAQSTAGRSALDLSYRATGSALPVAAYENISSEDFRSMVRKAFQQAGFSQVSVDHLKNGAQAMRFRFDLKSTANFRAEVLVHFDELLDGRKRCAPCFLRRAEIDNSPSMRMLPWMDQYDLNAALVPAIDQAFFTLESSGRKYLVPSFEFAYRQQWTGERNLFGNSFVGISLPDLKQKIVHAYRRAGFIPAAVEASSRNADMELAFVFPLDPSNDAGAIYKVNIFSQYDKRGDCHPCEVVENYNPHQQLPAAGLSGVLSRATLESRFTAARDAAYEGVRIELERYLRPRSTFSIPPKPAALGSPPPKLTPPAAT